MRFGDLEVGEFFLSKQEHFKDKIAQKIKSMNGYNSVFKTDSYGNAKMYCLCDADQVTKCDDLGKPILIFKTFLEINAGSCFKRIRDDGIIWKKPSNPYDVDRTIAVIIRDGERICFELDRFSVPNEIKYIICDENGNPIQC